VEILDIEATRVCHSETARHFEVFFEVRPHLEARKLLLATGMRDRLPEIENIKELYGTSVHHCPYCDAWEHRDRHLMALGNGSKAIGLSLALKTWSSRVTCCSNGEQLESDQIELLERNGIHYRHEAPVRFTTRDGLLDEVLFRNGTRMGCDAVFFDSDQVQRSHLPAQLGCDRNEQDMVRAGDRQGTGIRGLFLAGDADDDVQFTIVAAAEGAKAATAINRELQEEDRTR